MTRLVLIICTLALFGVRGFSQQLQNGGLEGPATGLSTYPPGWTNVPFDDPACLAFGTNSATPDLCDTSGPLSIEGIHGTPYEGSTFVSGSQALSVLPVDYWHEGIMQRVDSFVPGQMYRIRFAQAVVKELDVIDTSGGWAVYRDSTLLGITEPSVSYASYVSINLSWDLRELTWQAADTAHTLKFLPADDDGGPDNFPSYLSGALRMGIDGITLEPCFPLQTLDLGADTSICFPESLTLTMDYPGADVLWSTGSTNPSIVVNTTGSYHVAVTLNGCTFHDTIQLDVQNGLPQFDLGPDTSICEGDSLWLDVSNPGATYLWQDGSTQAEYIITAPNTYYVQVSNSCGVTTDTIVVNAEDDCETRLNFPNVFTPNGDGTNDVFEPISTNRIRQSELYIYNRWGQLLFFSDFPGYRWDGVAGDSREVPEGTYFYVIRYQDMQYRWYDQTGTFMLYR